MTAAASPPLPLDEHYGAVACFYAVLSILQKPLSQLFTDHGAAHALAGASRVARAALRKQLEFLRDRRDTHVGACEIASDVVAVLLVQSQGLYSPNVSTLTWAHAIELVVACGGDDYARQQVDSFQRLLLPTPSGDVQDEGTESNQVENHDVTETKAKASPRPSFVLSDPTPVKPRAPGTSRVSRQKARTEENGARMRKWLVGQALRHMESLPYENDEQQAAIGQREVVRLLTEALRFAKNVHQRSDVLLMRSECRLMFGDFELAGEDAHAALEPDFPRSVDVIQRIANVFMYLGRHDDAALAYDKGLKRYPGNKKLLKCKKQDVEDWHSEGATATTRTTLGLFHHDLWSNLDFASLGEEKEQTEWNFPISRDPISDLPDVEAVVQNNEVESIDDEDASDQEEADSNSSFNPTDSAYVVAEFALDADESAQQATQEDWEQAAEAIAMTR